MRVVATAGHVDHGKSSLVLALTGTDPDRFPEEKARGLTIDLGFAFTSLPSGRVVGFVDVPGHVRFVKNMLAGVGAVDVALLVVAANEGWMPQTDEHAAILDLLDVRHGMVAVTKAGLVDAETLELARVELEEHLAGTPAAGWPVVAVDSVSGRGLDDVRRTLDAVLDAAPPPRDDGRPRLWVDRVFSAKGAGTVVTGTLVGGSIGVDDEVLVEPGRRRARVRGIESQHERLERAAPGSRVALNLAGVGHDDVARGHAVVRPGQWATTTVVDVAVRALPGHALARRGLLQVHVGTGEHAARVRMLDPDGRWARVRLDTALPLAPGDRMVLRSSARQTTVAGAEVLDVEPARRTVDAQVRLARPLAARVMDAHPWATADELVPLHGREDAAAAVVEEGHAVRVGAWLVAPAALTSVRGRAVQLARTGGATGVTLAAVAAACGLDVGRVRAALAGEPAVVVDHDVVRDATRAAVTDDPAARALLDALAAAPFNPPAPAEVGAPPDLVRALVRAGRVVDVDGVVLHAGALDEARRRIARAVLERGTLTIADARDLLGSTRKYVVPIMKRMDAEGVTRRRGDDRVPGPRARQAVGEPPP
jgi:selenocysteine-specific elongation factor